MLSLSLTFKVVTFVSTFWYFRRKKQIGICLSFSIHFNDNLGVCDLHLFQQEPGDSRIGRMFCRQILEHQKKNAISGNMHLLESVICHNRVFSETNAF